MVQSLEQIQDDLLNHRISVTDLVSQYLQQIKKYEGLNIYVEVFEDEALQRAEALDQKIKQSPDTIGDLFG